MYLNHMHYTCDMTMLLNRDFDSINSYMFDIVIVFAIIILKNI
jgi:hypothetical protein